MVAAFVMSRSHVPVAGRQWHTVGASYRETGVTVLGGSRHQTSERLSSGVPSSNGFCYLNGGQEVLVHFVMNEIDMCSNFEAIMLCQKVDRLPLKCRGPRGQNLSRLPETFPKLIPQWNCGKSGMSLVTEYYKTNVVVYEQEQPPARRSYFLSYKDLSVPLDLWAA
nr:hypothetical protein CFP56_24227 [Quercus suber]